MAIYTLLTHVLIEVNIVSFGIYMYRILYTRHRKYDCCTIGSSCSDEIILKSFPSAVMIPFLLLHRTGFTRELVGICTTLCRRGINFYNMESIILERRWESYARQQEMLEIHTYLCSQPLQDFQQ